MRFENRRVHQGKELTVRITTERRAGRSAEDVVVPGMIDGLDRALRSLDGHGVTLVSLETGGRQLFIGGGPDCYTVIVRRGEDEIYDLIGDAERVGERTIVLGGQLMPVPERQCVSVERARAAALQFFKTGDVIVSDEWERQ